MNAHGSDRRTIPQRQTRWAKRAADFLFRARIRPNHISVASALIAIIGSITLVLSGPASGATRPALLIVTALCIPLRLLFNMLDGMLAVEKGLHQPTGDLFNEIPDRLADLALLAAAGYATAGLVITERGTDLGVLLGWLAACSALGTAYVRTLGAAQGVGNHFDGPTAKPARMWILFLACIGAIFEPGSQRGIAFVIALTIIALGSLATILARLKRITRALRSSGPDER